MVSVIMTPGLSGARGRCTSCLAPNSFLLTQRFQSRVPTVATRRLMSQQSPKRPKFSSRLRTALRNTKVQWYQIPVGLGIGFLGLVQFYKVSSREKEAQEQAARGGEPESRPKKRPRIRPDGPWYASNVLQRI